MSVRQVTSSEYRYNVRLFLGISGLEEKEEIKRKIEKTVGLSAICEKDNPILVRAAYGRDTKLVEALIECGADVDAQTKKGGITALIRSSYCGTTAMVEKLLDAGASVNIKDVKGRTALHRAITNGSPQKLVRMLLESGADVNCIDNDGTSPLVEAAKSGSVAYVKMLFEFGADIAQYGAKALFESAGAWRESKDCIGEIIRVGVNPDVENASGRTPAFVACQRGSSENLLALIEAEADLNKVDHNGLRAQDMLDFRITGPILAEKLTLLVNAGANLYAAPPGDSSVYEKMSKDQERFREVLSIFETKELMRAVKRKHRDRDESLGL